MRLAAPGDVEVRRQRHRTAAGEDGDVARGVGARGRHVHEHGPHTGRRHAGAPDQRERGRHASGEAGQRVVRARVEGARRHDRGEQAVAADGGAAAGDVALEVGHEVEPRLAEQRHLAVGRQRHHHQVGDRLTGLLHVQVRRQGLARARRPRRDEARQRGVGGGDVQDHGAGAGGHLAAQVDHDRAAGGDRRRRRADAVARVEHPCRCRRHDPSRRGGARRREVAGDVGDEVRGRHGVEVHGAVGAELHCDEVRDGLALVLDVEVRRRRLRLGRRPHRDEAGTGRAGGGHVHHDGDGATRRYAPVAADLEPDRAVGGHEAGSGLTGPVAGVEQSRRREGDEPRLGGGRTGRGDGHRRQPDHQQGRRHQPGRPRRAPGHPASSGPRSARVTQRETTTARPAHAELVPLPSSRRRADSTRGLLPVRRHAPRRGSR